MLSTFAFFKLRTKLQFTLVLSSDPKVIAGFCAGLCALAIAFPSNLSAQACVGTPPGLVSWWAGDGNADDLSGLNPGTLQNGTSFSAGQVDQAFNFNGSADYFSVVDSPSLDVGTGNGFTIECWINPSDVSRTQIIGEWNNGSGGLGVQLFHSDPGIGGVGSIAANVQSTSGANHIFASSSLLLTAGNFQHIALTYDRVNGTGKLYYNGAVVATQNLGVFTPQTTYPVYFGARISGAAAVGSFFAGQMDEISLYNRPLDDTEIQGIYDAGSSGKCKGLTPTIGTEPGNRIVLAGGNAIFSVGAYGPSLAYQWHFNGSDIAGATDATLSLSNVQTNQAGNYSVTITNTYGSTNSSDAALVIIPSCVSAPPNLVSWWPADNASNDPLNGNDGVLRGGLGFAQGEAGLGFNFDGTNDFVRVAASPTLDFGAGDGMTFECWLKPADISSAHDIVEWNNAAGGIGVHFHHSNPGIGGLGSLFANLVTTNGANHIFASSANLLTTNTFQHVAFTYNRTNGIAKIYRDGVVVASNNFGVLRLQTTYPLYMGARVSGGATSYYKGAMDEVAVYNQALTDTEVLSIVAAGSLGKTCTPPEILAQPQGKRVNPGTNVTFSATARGTAPLAYQWRLNGINLNGATNISLTLSNVQPSNAGNYSLRVSNFLGSATSSNASLKVDVVFAYGNGVLLTKTQANYGSPVTIELQNVYSNGIIFYTLDGSTPTLASAQYSGPFIVSHDAILRALGYSPDFFQSGEMDPVAISILPTYSLVATTAGGGAIALHPPGGSYLKNTVINLTATPASGWTFLQWLGDDTSTNATYSLVMTRNKSVRAVFGTTLSASVAGNGSVVLSPPGGVYPYGTTVLLSAIPQPGNYFGLWGNAASGSVNPYSFLVTNPTPMISSLFGSVGAGQAALTVVPVGNGQISVNPRANIYNVGQSVSVTASPDAGQTFLGWSGDAVGTQNPLSLSMNQSKVIYASFTEKPNLSVRAAYEGLKPEGFVLTLSGAFGAKYQIGASTNLTSWTSLTILTNTLGTAQYLDSGATNLNRRFYRATLLP